MITQMKYKGRTYDVVDSKDNGDDCQLCCFKCGSKSCDENLCYRLDRKDGRSVYFAKHVEPKTDTAKQPTTSHDAHYREIESRGVEPIAVMEAIACNGLPKKYHDIARRNLNLAIEAKYNLRLGEKDDAEKELDKGDNYRYRARHKKWPWDK